MEPEIKLPPRISFKVCNNTPWMLKGADATRLEQLNGKALRGVMRFWFRALYYGAGEVFPDYSIDGNLQKLNVLENFLFGGQRNRGLVNIVVRDKISERSDLWPEYRRMTSDTRYKGLYLGYHATHKDDRNRDKNKPDITNNLNKRYEWSVDFIFNPIFGERGGDLSIKPAQKKFSAEEILYNEVAAFYIDEPQKLYSMILDSFEALLLFGGIGSRSRKGFGSLEVIKEPEKNNIADARLWNTANIAPNNILKIFVSLIKKGNLFKSLPEITAFSSRGILGLFFLRSETSYNVMKVYDDNYLLFRKWDSDKLTHHHRGGISGGKLENALLDFGKKAVSDGGVELEKAIKENLKRYCLGLPLEFPKVGAMKTDEGKIFSGTAERRSSPLFFSIVPAVGGFFGVVTYLPAKFVPTSELAFKYGGKTAFFHHNTEIERSYIGSIIKNIKGCSPILMEKI